MKNALISVNDAVFQNVCDSILISQNKEYAVCSRTGSQFAKQKTRKGTPDSFILLENGQYLFVKFSTNVSAGVNKLKDDVNKCLDEEKTGIGLTNINQIILCVNFNLKLEEVDELKSLVKTSGVELKIHTLESLALDIQFHYRDIANEY